MKFNLIIVMLFSLVASLKTIAASELSDNAGEQSYVNKKKRQRPPNYQTPPLLGESSTVRVKNLPYGAELYGSPNNGPNDIILINDFKTETSVTPSGMLMGMAIPPVENTMIESSSEIMGRNVQSNQAMNQTGALSSEVDKK